MQTIPQTNITCIKIGGSLITDKQQANSVNAVALAIIASEIKLIISRGQSIILGHGAGSFGHVPAHKYQTHKGIVNAESITGIAEVAHAMRELNVIVMRALLERGVPAVSVSPLATMGAKNFELETIDTRAVRQLLALGMVPVVCGDQILDSSKGCAIFSTEKVLSFIAIDLQQKGYQIDHMIHCGSTNGVYDKDGNTIPLINSANYDSIHSLLGASNGVDVTGGMLHKVDETLALAKQGIPGCIIDGVDKGSLSRLVAGEKVLGTYVEA